MAIYRNIITKNGVIQFDGNSNGGHRIFIDTSTVNGQLEAFQKSYTVQSAISKRVAAILNLRVWAKDIYFRKVNNQTVKDDLKKLSRFNPYQDFNKFNSLIEVQCLTHGVAYVYKGKAVGFSGDNCYVVPNDIIYPVFSGAQKYNSLFEVEPDYYNVSLPDGKTLRIETDEIVCFRDNWIRNLSGGYGLSRLQAVQEPIITLLSAGNTISTLYAEGGMRGILSLGAKDRETFSAPLLNNDKNELQEEIKKYGSLRNQFHYIIARSAIDYIPITSKIVDMQLPENLRLAESAIYGAFGVPNAFLEMETRYKALPEARKEFITGTIAPEISSRYKDLVKLRGIPERDWEYYPDWSHLDFYQEDLQKSATAALNAATAAEKMDKAGVTPEKIMGFLEYYLE